MRRRKNLVDKLAKQQYILGMFQEGGLHPERENSGGIMGRVEEIQEAIESLPQEEYRRLREWFIERDWEEWDREIEAGSKAGKELPNY